MSQPLLGRIQECVSRAHDANLELLELADELREHATRSCGMTERLQKTVMAGLDAPGVTRLPRGIQPEKQEASA